MTPQRARRGDFQLLQNRALELASEDRPLHAALDELMRAVEAHSSAGVLGSVLLLDERGGHLRHGAAPSLPDAYNAAIDGIAIGSGVGSCGTAAGEKRPVHVADIANDPLWADFRDLALSHGLRACWSTPIVDADGDVLGTFAMYYREPRSPLADDLRMVEVVTRAASFIIRRSRTLGALAEKEERLRLATDHAEIGFWDVDLVNDRLIWPTRMKAMFGISPDVPVSLADFYGGLHPADRDVTSLAFDAAADPQLRALYDVQFRTVGKEDGVIRWVGAKGRGVFDEDGRCLRVLGTAINITARKQIEETLAVLAESLETRVTERTAELETAHEALRQAQKMEAIGQLTGGVAHDFNNLLTVIRGSVDLLKRDDLPAEKRTRYIDAIGTTADRAAKLTGQLLAFARRQALKPEVFDAGASIREVAGILRTMAGSRVTMEVHVPDEECFILADRSQFDTAIINLGINARDAMGGEGLLTIATGPVSGIPAIRSHAALAGDFVAITVTDAGTGIPPEDILRIFEPFFTTKPQGQGTGLGLSQVFGFAKQSGGDVRVESVVGHGTTFTLYLPRSLQVEAAVPVAAMSAALSGKGICVLIVEDNAEVGEFAADALRQLGYETGLASDADAALERLASPDARFRIVFSDVVMPGRSGLELGEEVRRLYPDIAVVLTSGYSHVLARNGAHGFELLHKPYSLEQLSRVLNKAGAWRAHEQAGSLSTTSEPTADRVR